MRLSSIAAATLLLTIACQPMNTPPQPTPMQQPSVPPHSWSNPEEARVEHLTLDLSVDFPAKQLVGAATLRIAMAPGARKLVLDARDLTIERVFGASGDLPYRMGTVQSTFGAPFEISLPAGTKSVTIQYRTSPGAAALQWLEPAQTAGKRWPFLLSQSQSILARTWVPIQDTPTVRFTYEATIRVPKDLVAIMSAENPTERNATGVYRFRMPQAIPSYLLAIAVGDIAFRPLDARSGVYAEPSVVESAAREFVDIPRMMTAAEQLYGPYRWGRYDVLVLPPSFPFGGMENPRLTFLTPTLIAGDRSLVSVVAHELAHSWSGNLVTNATWNDFWLNEGFTTYLERRISEQLYGVDHAEMLWTLGGKDLQDEFELLPPADEGLKVDLTGRDPDEGSTQVPYEKGSLFLRLIEEKVGRGKLDAFLRRYFDEFAFKTMTTEKFFDLLRARLLVPNNINEADLQIDTWVNKPGLPSNVPMPRSEAFALVEAQSAAFGRGAAASSLATSNWNTHQWLHFLHSLPKPLTTAQMADLDRQFRFTQSGNSEILEAWLEHAIDYGYEPAYGALEDFLLRQGRRKYLKPLYTKMAATPAGLERAKRIYSKARSGYHSVSTQTIDGILKWSN